MDNVIDFTERRNKKLEVEVEALQAECESWMFLLDPEFRSKKFLESHSITASYRKKGKKLATNTPKEEIFESMGWVKENGWTDLEVEKTAIYGTSQGIVIYDGYFAIYGIPPGIVAKALVKDHPIPSAYREQGKRFITNASKEEASESLKWAKKNGFEDLVVEETAMVQTPYGTRFLGEGSVAIYGVLKRRN